MNCYLNKNKMRLNKTEAQLLCSTLQDSLDLLRCYLITIYVTNPTLELSTYHHTLIKATVTDGYVSLNAFLEQAKKQSLE